MADGARVEALRERFLALRGLAEGDLPAWQERSGCDPAWFAALLDLEARFGPMPTGISSAEP